MNTTRLRISEQQLDTIRQHVQSTYPEEGGGLLLGHLAKDGATVEQVRSIPNTWQADAERRRRYLIPADVMLREMRHADDHELDIVGYFHSHPDHPAAPSEFDRDHALPGWSYVIASVRDGRVGEIQVWRLRDDRSAFDAQELATL
jgi:proteasome lid subunit RPN8/RPN11